MQEEMLNVSNTSYEIVKSYKINEIYLHNKIISTVKYNN